MYKTILQDICVYILILDHLIGQEIFVGFYFLLCTSLKILLQFPRLYFQSRRLQSLEEFQTDKLPMAWQAWKI